MSDKFPRKFTFDEFYEMLKAYVSNEKAGQFLAIYDAEVAAGRGRIDMSDCIIAADASGNLLGIAWHILNEHGWPTYLEVVRAREAADEAYFDAETPEDRESARLLERSLSDVFEGGKLFSEIGNMIIRGSMPKIWPGETFDIDDKASIRKLIELIDRIKPGREVLPCDLAGRN